ncbi:MAG: aminotransferase class V-fold PLP-dependent enzyme [Phycisphaerales bacterium]|nr:aminotransferase class V-fold PLP-dependent enzyme [Phycisphaerales bacterium]
MAKHRRYFDNAATSFPKPPQVASAVVRYMTRLGAPGRGTYTEARSAAALIDQCRERISRLVNGPGAGRVVFTHNTTDALNLAIKGVLRHALASRRGRVHAVTTCTEHNSVLRPLRAMAAESARVDVTIIACDPSSGQVSVDELLDAVRPGQTALVAVNHASNVTGTLQPLSLIGPAVRAAGDWRPLLLVDGAQSLGHTPFDMAGWCVDLLAFPGHKGLLGPQGTGGLVIAAGAEGLVNPLREGGTGNRSELEQHPDTLPDKYEAGSHNTAGIIGLSEGVRWLVAQRDGSVEGAAAVRAREERLMLRMLNGLAAIPGLRVLGPTAPADRVGVFSIVHASAAPAEIAQSMEARHGIITRAGLHCAPLMHRAIGTAPARGPGAGTVRLSLGPFLTEHDVDSAVGAIENCCGTPRLIRKPRSALPVSG